MHISSSQIFKILFFRENPVLNQISSGWRRRSPRPRLVPVAVPTCGGYPAHSMQTEPQARASMNQIAWHGVFIAWPKFVVCLYVSACMPGYLCICLYICLFVCLYLSVCLSVWLSLSVLLSVCLYNCWSLPVAVSVCVCMSLSVSVCLCVSLYVSVCLSDSVCHCLL